MRRHVTLIALFLWTLTVPAFAIELGQVDDFQDATTQGWGSGSPNPSPPVNGADQGPGGAGDDALVVTSSGGFGAGGKLVAINTAQWTGNYQAAGVAGVELDLSNESADDLDIRLAVNGPGGWFATDAVMVPAGAGFDRYALSLAAGDLIALDAGPTDPGATLGAVSEMRLIHAPSPDFRGADVEATLVVDNVTAVSGCVAGPNALCLAGGRFRVEIDWTDFSGNVGRGIAVGLTPDTGYFWFFGPNNIEVVVKVLDATRINGNFWVFYGSLSNVAYEITVTDTANGRVKTYLNPAGGFASVGDTAAFTGP